MNIGCPLMHQTTSLTLQIRQGLCNKHSVAFSNWKNSCMMSNRPASKCSSNCCTFNKPGSNLSIEFKKQAKSCQELQAHSWLMSHKKLILQGSISLLDCKECIWHRPYQHHHQRLTPKNHCPGQPWMVKLWSHGYVP